MPPKRKAAETVVDGVPGKPAHPEYVNGYQIGHIDGQEIGRREGYAEGLAASGEDAVKAAHTIKDKRVAERPSNIATQKALERYDAETTQLFSAEVEKIKDGALGDMQDALSGMDKAELLDAASKVGVPDMSPSVTSAVPASPVCLTTALAPRKPIMPAEPLASMRNASLAAVSYTS